MVRRQDLICGLDRPHPGVLRDAFIDSSLGALAVVGAGAPARRWRQETRCARLRPRSGDWRRSRRRRCRALVRPGSVESPARRVDGLSHLGRKDVHAIRQHSSRRGPARSAATRDARRADSSQPTARMILTATSLEGPTIRLEPLSLDHLDALSTVALDPELWRLTVSAVSTRADLEAYVREALAEQSLGTALPFVTRLRVTGQVIGSTRFGNVVPAHRRAE